MTISLTIVGFDLFIVSRTPSIKNYRSYILYKFLVISLSVRQKPVKKILLLFVIAQLRLSRFPEG